MVPCLSEGNLALESRPLIYGIIQLSERVCYLPAPDKKLEAIGEVRILIVSTGKG